jgi:hypothetical protein
MIWRRKRSYIQLDTGRMEFRCVLPDGMGAAWESDCVSLQLIAEHLQKECNLQIDQDGRAIATPEFLQRLADRYVSEGCTGCTLTAARQIWIAVAERFNSLEAAFRKQL